MKSAMCRHARRWIASALPAVRSAFVAVSWPPLWRSGGGDYGDRYRAGGRGGSGAAPGFDWDATERLHKKDFISDPVGKAKSVILTDEGQREAEHLFAEMFTARGERGPLAHQRCATRQTHARVR